MFRVLAPVVAFDVTINLYSLGYLTQSREIQIVHIVKSTHLLTKRSEIVLEDHQCALQTAATSTRFEPS